MKKKLNITTQFFLSHMLGTVISICAISVFIYIYISNILIERERASLEMMTENFMTQTDSAIRTLDDVSLNISYSNLIFNKINDYFASDLSINNDDFAALVQLFVALNGVNFNASQINVYGLKGQKVMVGTYTNTAIIDLEELDWIALADEAQGTKVISRPYATSTMISSNKVTMDYISVYRAYYDKYGRKCGYIETVQTCKNIFREIISYINANQGKNNAQIYIFDSSGGLIYPFKSSELPTTDLSAFYFNTLGEYPTQSAVTLQNQVTGEQELLTYTTSAYTGWSYICIQKENIILKPVHTFRQILLFASAVLMMIAFFISYQMSRNLTRPIRQLLKTFHKTNLETLGSVKKYDMQSSFNEFDELNDAFNQMQKDLKFSMDALIETRQQELKSRSLALQSQINPHFYYNSLTTIIVLTENGQSEEVILFSKNLSSMMRYITNGNMQVVTLGAEISYIQKYLYCMKTRYQSSLNYEINVDATLYDKSIPKLLIQPIVENAIKYGTNCDPPWRISLESEITEDKWSITVRDHGSGFTEAAMQTIHKRFETADKSIGMPELQINGMGMVNVYSRWRLFCGEEGFFHYGNHENGGAYVTIGQFIKTEE